MVEEIGNLSLLPLKVRLLDLTASTLGDTCTLSPNTLAGVVRAERWRSWVYFISDPLATALFVEVATGCEGFPAVGFTPRPLTKTDGNVMRVLFRRTRRHIFEVVGADGSTRYDYPGAIAVRPEVRVVDARRVGGAFLRPVVSGDRSSLQLTHPLAPGEERWEALEPSQAVLHNSWARSPREIRQKTRSWGHASGWRGRLYYFAVWLPIPVTWRWARDIHPFARGLWPRVERRVPTREETG